MTMSMPIWIFILLSEAGIIIECAPKLGHVLFEPLSYEAEKFERVKTLLKELMPASTTKIVPPVTKTITTTTTGEIISTNQKATLSDRKDEPSLSKLTDVFKIIEDAWNAFRKQANPIKFLRTNAAEQPENKEPCAEYEYNGKICKIINNRLLCGYNKNTGELNNNEFVDMGNGCRARNGRIECGYQKEPFNNLRRPPARDETSNQDEILPLDNKAVPKLRTDHSITSVGSVLRHCDGCKTPPSERIDTLSEIETTSDNDETTTAQVTDSWLEQKETTQGSTDSSPELVAKTQSLPEIVGTTNVTTDTSPTLVVTKSSQKFTVTRVTTDSTPEFVTTTSHEKDVTTPEAVQTSPTVTSKDMITVPVASDITKITLKVNSTSSPKVLRWLRSIAETSEKSTANVVKPTRWCVEKGDRIVCYYAKNY